MPKVKESSLRGILCTFLVNFFEISLLPSFCSLPSSLSLSLCLSSLGLLFPLKYTLPRLHELAVCYRLTGSIERTTRHSCNCSCSRIFPSPFVPPASASFYYVARRLSRPAPTPTIVHDHSGHRSCVQSGLFPVKTIAASA